MGEAQGYAYGDVSPSPVSLDELDELVRAVGFEDDDREALRRLWELIGPRLDPLFEAWMSRIAWFFAPTFAGPDGVPIGAYMDAAHPRLLRWIEDTCTRPYDRAWLDYQHEIALRHHRTKKNEVDGFDAIDVVPYRYLPVTVVRMAEGVEEVLSEAGVSEAERRPLVDAWTKSLLLQVALWSRAYVAAADW